MTAFGPSPASRPARLYSTSQTIKDKLTESQENHWANITCGRSRTKIAGMSRESFPELPQMPESIAEIPVAELASMIVRTSFAISMEESRFTLNGALFLLTGVYPFCHRFGCTSDAADAW